MRNLKYIQAARENLENFKTLLFIFGIFTLVLIYYNLINLKSLLLSIISGSLLLLFEFIWYKYILAKFANTPWSYLEDIRSFLMVVLFIIIGNKYGVVYLLILLDSYILLKLIFKKNFLNFLKDLEEKIL